MSFAYHGNYCGPGWSAGQYKDAKDLKEEDFQVPAVDKLDEVCKRHDYAIWMAHQLFPRHYGQGYRTLLETADAEFIRDTYELNTLGANTAAFMVWILGPTGRLTRAMEYVKKHFVQEPGKSLFNLPNGCRNESKRRSLGRI